MKNFMIHTIGSFLNLLSYLAPRPASNLALKLFSSPQKGRLTDTQIPTLQTANFEEFEYNSFPIAVYRWPGKKRRILLLHGWESNASRWHYLITKLKAQDYAVIAIDAPAHGKSGSKQFNAILYAEFINVVAKKYSPEIIIGHSVGGMAAVFSTFKYPISSLEKIVLLGSPAHFDGVFERYVTMMSYNKRIAEGMNQLIVERYNQPKSYFSTASFAKHLNCDALIVHDKYDDVIPYEDALSLHQNFPNSNLVTTEHLGHSLKQDEVTEVISNFINA